MYDITNRESFDNVKTWLAEARANGNPELVILLCGNKIDRDDERVVTHQEGEALARNNGILFFESSAKENISIPNLFFGIAREVKKKVDSGIIDPNSDEFGVRRLGLTASLKPHEKHTLNSALTSMPSPKKKKNCC